MGFHGSTGAAPLLFIDAIFPFSLVALRLPNGVRETDANYTNSDELYDKNESRGFYGEYDIIFKDAAMSPALSDEMTLIQVAAGDFFMHGDILKRWNLGKTIGRGSYSVVKIATGVNDPRGREVALKIISKSSQNYKEKTVAREIFIWRLVRSWQTGRDIRTRQGREIARPVDRKLLSHNESSRADRSASFLCPRFVSFLVRQLMETGGHENIVNMYEVGESDDFVFLVMEW